MAKIDDAVLLALAKKGGGGGGGGTTNYNQLTNRPQVEGQTLQGNMTLHQLGIASEDDTIIEHEGELTNIIDDSSLAEVAKSQCGISLYFESTIVDDSGEKHEEIKLSGSSSNSYAHVITVGTAVSSFNEEDSYPKILEKGHTYYCKQGNENYNGSQYLYLVYATGSVSESSPRIPFTKEGTEFTVPEDAGANNAYFIVIMPTLNEDYGENPEPCIPLVCEKGEPAKSSLIDKILALQSRMTSAEDAISALEQFDTYLGITTTELTDGSTINPIVIAGESVTAVAGNIVIYGSKEFIFNGTRWQEFGDLSQLNAKVSELEYHDRTHTSQISALQEKTTNLANQNELQNVDIDELKYLTLGTSVDTDGNLIPLGSEYWGEPNRVIPVGDAQVTVNSTEQNHLSIEFNGTETDGSYITSLNELGKFKGLYLPEGTYKIRYDVTGVSTSNQYLALKGSIGTPASTYTYLDPNVDNTFTISSEQAFNRIEVYVKLPKDVAFDRLIITPVLTRTVCDVETLNDRITALEEGGGGGTTSVELSYADYLALSPEAKADPTKVYYVPDGPGGGAGGGAQIDDDNVSTETTFSSSKIMEEIGDMPVSSGSNENLILNGWFRCNQQCLDAYNSTTNQIPTVDMWFAENYAGVSRWSQDKTDVYLAANRTNEISYFYQFILDERAQKLISSAGKKATLSVRVKDSSTGVITIHHITGTIPNLTYTDTVIDEKFLHLDIPNTVFSVEVHAVIRRYNRNICVQFVSSGAIGTFLMEAVKLEISDTSTLDLDIAPDYALELLKCQRYWYALSKGYSGLPVIVNYDESSAGTLSIVGSTRFTPPVPMGAETAENLSYASIFNRGNYDNRPRLYAVNIRSSNNSEYLVSLDNIVVFNRMVYMTKTQCFELHFYATLYGQSAFGFGYLSMLDSSLIIYFRRSLEV